MRVAVFIVLLLASLSGWAGGPQDPRYCGPPKRDADGVIVRSRQVLRDFQKLYPCPETGRTTGACPGWFKDHTVPLVCGGCDSVGNLQWLPAAIKTCAGKVCKDRWEIRVYCRHEPTPPPVPIQPEVTPQPDPAEPEPTPPPPTETRTEP